MAIIDALVVKNYHPTTPQVTIDKKNQKSSKIITVIANIIQLYYDNEVCCVH